MASREHTRPTKNFEKSMAAGALISSGGVPLEPRVVEVALESPGDLTKFSQLWGLVRPQLARRVARVLSEFGDVDDLVDDVLDAARNRCEERASSRPVNKRFIWLATTRVALTKLRHLRGRRKALSKRRPRMVGDDGHCEPMRRLDTLRKIDQVLMAANNTERQLIFEILRQYRDNKALSYQELARALDCAEWKARARTSRCFSKIRARLKRD